MRYSILRSRKVVFTYLNPERIRLTASSSTPLLRGRILRRKIDASLSFIRDQNNVQIVASSNGFLLCCTNLYENVDCVICNPVTSKAPQSSHSSRSGFYMQRGS
ncbi:hypothetical protein ACH5RR_028174 [Cinchona calisaya]|uniref:Uncharacterized protein n=1 Tax=Cinchona calisaya TaxID=153742 RepID=A0ABD2YTB7_9GENT